MKLLKLVIVSLMWLAFGLIFNSTVQAGVNPWDYPNNKFGIHILDPKDLPQAAELVNSSGGNWGYVTLVIQENDRDIKKWQKIFDEMRRLKLIPIIRIASQQQADGWKKLESGDIDSWIYFLNSLNWVIKNRYVIIGNETNHAVEWGDEVNPEQYADYFLEFSQKAKEASADFFLLPAALDASAPDNRKHLSAEKYIRRLLAVYPDFYNSADGWASHSYPNPDFSGSETDKGKGSILTFDWEMQLLRSLNIEKKFPVFITETGWIHNGKGELLPQTSGTNIAQKYQYAFSSVWNDSRVVAVTPFILSYFEEPFAKFSWKKNSTEFYPFYYDLQAMPKVSGQPVQEENGEIGVLFSPNIILQGQTVNAYALVKNTGQTIWNANEIDLVEVIDGRIFKRSLITKPLEPFDRQLIHFQIQLPNTEGQISGVFKFSRGEKLFGTDYRFQILSVKPVFKKPSLIDQIRQTLLQSPLNFVVNEFRRIF